MPFNRRTLGSNLHPGHLATKTDGIDVLKLVVVSPSAPDAEFSMVAAMNPASLEQAGISNAEGDSIKAIKGGSNMGRQPSRIMLELAAGSDCVVSVRLDNLVPEGCIELSQVQQRNLRVAKGDTYKFRLFNVPEEESFDLVDIDVEVRPWSSQGPAIVVDAEAVTKEFAKLCFGIVLTVSQLAVVSVGGERLVLRIASTNVLDSLEQDEAIGYHCYRGILCPTTAVYIRKFETTSHETVPVTSQEPNLYPDAEPNTSCGTSTSGSGVWQGSTPSCTAGHGSESAMSGSGSPSCPEVNTQHVPLSGNGAHVAASCQEDAPRSGGKLLQMRIGAGDRLTLINTRCRELLPPQTNIVNVYTSDGEWFPVKKKLLRSCIKLTAVVRDTSAEAPSVTITVSTLVFDRVLRFLECEVLGKELPSFTLQHLEELLQAVEDLGIASLEQHCKVLLGEAESQLRVYSFAEVQHYNSLGNCWLILDGMILDVTRWLPEHPGGSTIIPKQALNLDCARFFEIYHASRESFIYLKEFYIGELDPMDLPTVPKQKEEPTADFLQQLREYTAFRMQLQPKVFKSF